MVQNQQRGTVKIKDKDYVTVATRVASVHADQDAQGFSMIAQEVYERRGRDFLGVTIVVKGKQYRGDAEIKFDAKANTPDGTNPLECAQTSALGRALGFAGYGTVESIASADEVLRAQHAQQWLYEQIGLSKNRATALGLAHNAEEWKTLLTLLGLSEIGGQADLTILNDHLAKLEQQASASDSKQGTLESIEPITEQQIASIRKLSEYLQKAEPANLTEFSFLDAKKHIQSLTSEYRQSKKAS